MADETERSREFPDRQALEEALGARCGQEIQRKLRDSYVAVAGLGGLGSNVATALARAGVGRLLLVDFDRVDISNLNRQHYFIKHLGMPKPEALKEQLLQINPWMKVETAFVKVTQENIEQLFQNVQVVCEAFDRAENKAMLVNKVLELFPQKGLICASGLAGYGRSNQIQTRKIGRNFYLCGDEVSENLPGMGLWAPRAALCAAHQANAVLEFLLGPQDTEIQ